MQDENQFEKLKIKEHTRVMLQQTKLRYPVQKHEEEKKNDDTSFFLLPAQKKREGEPKTGARSLAVSMQYKNESITSGTLHYLL